MTKSELLDAMKDAPMDAEIEMEFFVHVPAFKSATEDAVRSVVTGYNAQSKTHWVLISNRKP